MPQHLPFVILSLPRSRTFWLSKFLSYGNWHCGHDELRHVRTLGDVASWLSQPCTGSVETAGAPFWRMIPSNARIVIVRRPVEEVVNSMIASMPPGVFDRDGMTRLMKRQEHKLAQASKRLANPLVVNFADLQNETTCAQIFEFCLPYKHDPAWWRSTSGVNLQINMPAFMRYVLAYQPQIAGAAFQAKAETITALRSGQKWRSL